MSRIRSGALVLLAAGGFMTVAPGQAMGQKKQRDLITREEIESSPKRVDYIYDVIRSLRPHFLEAPRGVRRTGIDGPGARQPGAASSGAGLGAGGSNTTEVAVFVGDNHMGGIDILKGIQAEQVEEVRFFDSGKATAEFGMTLGAGGVIVVKLYKGKPPERPASPN